MPKIPPLSSLLSRFVASAYGLLSALDSCQHHLISTHKDRVFLSAQQANELLNAADGHKLKALIYIALYYGLRRSELVGLRWDAIDMDNNTLEINYTVTQVRQVLEKDRTKTPRSRAKYVLLKNVKEVLKLI